MTIQKNTRRVSLRVEAAPDSVEAKLLNHIKGDAIAPSRDIMLRALKAFYLPWALEPELDDAELRSLAQSAIEELQFRIFQIQQRYLASSSGGHKSAPPVLNQRVNGGMPSNGSSPAAEYSAPSIEDIRNTINPADLDDF